MIEINLINREGKSKFDQWERFCRFSVILLPNNKNFTIFMRGYGLRKDIEAHISKSFYSLKKVQIVTNQREN